MLFLPLFVVFILNIFISVPKPTAPTQPAPTAQHKVTATVFWVGERGSSDNGNIPNAASAWDEHWRDHFGGTDDPNSRNGFYPKSFKPKENPFYFALPYSDVDNNGQRRSTAHKCPNAETLKNKPYSWCKNAWIAISYQGKTAYAQWEDVGPYEENDVDYVFGTSPPYNKIAPRSGLDVSPAVRDYLGLHGEDTTSWQFVPDSAIPDGPWRSIITTTLGDVI